MGNLAITYQHIADILSFTASKSKLEETLKNSNFDWDVIVVEGSKHLVLPALFCRLKSKELLHVLPKELEIYLEEITSINRNRNESILKQVHSISQLLNKNKIEHVFVKGSALLALGCYRDNAERMVGDIDILVADHHLEKAFQLLQNNKYTPIDKTLGENFFEHRHLPRLKSESYICSIELHRKLLASSNYKLLNLKSVLKTKRKQNSIILPSQKHLLMHNILGYQINDFGNLYNSINFRSAYDTLILQKEYNGDQSWFNKKSVSKYFNYLSLFFEDIDITTNAKSNLFTSFYLFKLRHIKFYKLWNGLLMVINLIPRLIKRLSLFISNRRYQKAVINDRRRILKHLISILYKS